MSKAPIENVKEDKISLVRETRLAKLQASASVEIRKEDKRREGRRNKWD